MTVEVQTCLCIAFLPEMIRNSPLWFGLLEHQQRAIAGLSLISINSMKSHLSVPLIKLGKRGLFESNRGY